jgi:hypothetical protein
MTLASLAGVGIPEIKLVEMGKLDHLPPINLPNELYAFGIKRAKQRAKLSRILGKKALKSFHPRLFNDRLFAGDTWSDKNGCPTRNQTSALC